MSLLNGLHYTRLAESVLPNEKPLLPIAFRLYNHSLAFRSIMFIMHTNLADCATLASRSRYFQDTCFSRRMLVVRLHDCIILLSPNCPSVSSDVAFEQHLEPPVYALHATPNWDLASRYSSWPKLLRTTTYLYRFLNRFRRSKKQANNATLLLEEIQNAKRYSKSCSQSCFLMRRNRGFNT